jgi:two-component system, NtrC family, sensor kinase
LAKVQHAVNSGRPYAIAFVDVRMPPGWDGIETISRLWQVDPDLQVIVCTAYSDYSWDTMIEKLGRTDRLVILKKPFDNVEVLQMANAFAEKWCLLQDAKTHISDLEEEVQERTGQWQSSESRYRVFCDSSPLGIFQLDNEGHCSYCNPRWVEISGRSVEQNLGLGWKEAIDADDYQVLALLCKMPPLKKNTPWWHEHKITTPKGEVGWVKCAITQLTNSAGEPTGCLMTTEDISEKKRLQRERDLIEVELRQSQKLEAVGRLAAGIAHEINTPTQFIGDNTRFLKDAFSDFHSTLQQYQRQLDAIHQAVSLPELKAEFDKARQSADLDYLFDEVPKAIQQTLDGVDRVSKIVRAMKDFSHPGLEEKVPLDLNRAIESTVTVARNEWKYIAEMEMAFDDALPPVLCIPGEVNQVILNLIVNASHAIAEKAEGDESHKGLISISTRADGEFAEVAIRDSGGGIPKEIWDRVFEPFFTTKPVGKGTGQGLAIAHSIIVDKHKGSITFDSEVGKGTTFFIRLPFRAAVSRDESKLAA